MRAAAMLGRTALAMLAAFGAGGALAQPPGPETIPVMLRPYAPSNLNGYFIAFLMAPGQPRPMTRELFIRHEAYIRQQFEAGVLRLAGPMTDDGTIRGLYVVSAPTREAALAIVAADPIVQEGGFRVEMRSAMFPDLSAVRVEYRPAAH